MLIHAMLIALIVRGKDIIKYRLISLDGQKAEVYDATENQIVTVIKNKSMDISNIRIQGGKVKGYGAKLNRYAQLNENGQLTSEKSPLVVINRIVKDGRVIGYKVSDYKGTVVNGKLDDVVNYAVKNGIANGKIVEKEGKKFISSILDEYSENEIKQPIINTADKAERSEKAEKAEKAEEAEKAVSDTLSNYKTNQLVSSTENINNSSEAKGIEKSSQSDTSKPINKINNNLDKKQTSNENRACLEWNISCKLKKNKIKSLSNINITTYREIFKTAWFIGGRKYGKSLANSHYTEIDIKSCKIRTYKLEKDSLNAESLAKLQAMPGWNNSSKYVTFTTIEGNEHKDKSVVNGYFSSMEIKSVVRALLSIQSKLSKDQSDLVRGQVNLSNYYIISEFEQNTISDVEVSYMVIGIGRKTGRCKLIAVREFIEDGDAITEAYEVLSIKDIRGLILCGLTSSYEDNKFATLNTKKIYDMPTIFKYINDYDSMADNEISLADIVNSDISVIAKAREIAIRKYIDNMEFSGDINILLEISK